MIIKELRTNTHSHDDCKFNRNFLYSRRILQIFCSGVEKTYHSGAWKASSQPSQPHVRQRDHDDTDTVPYPPFPRPEVILPGLCLPAHAQGFPRSRILHALRGASGSGGASPVALPPDLCPGQVHGHLHHRLHAPGVLPHQAGEAAQDHEGMGRQGKVHDGLVLWIQAASGHQRQGGDHSVAANPGKRRRQGTAEEQGVYRETLRETLRRQGVYQPEPLRDALR